jgi:signal transduction histidine kinase
LVWGFGYNPVMPPDTPLPDSQASQFFDKPIGRDVSPSAPTAPSRRQARLTGSYVTVVCALVLTLAVVGASAWLAWRNARALEAASRTQEVRAAVARLLEDVTDAETGQRGFLLTGKDAYLAPYERGVRQAPATLERLAVLLAGDTASDQVMAQLRALVGGKIAELAQTVASMRAGDRAGAFSLVQSDRGQSEMEAIRTLTGRIADRQQAALNEQLRAVEAGGRMIVVIDGLGLGLLLLLAAAILRSTRRAVTVLRAAQTDLARANDELEGVNERLEHKVAQRTADLTAANDEIQRFAYIVSHDLRAPLVNIMGFTGELEAATKTIAGYVAGRVALDPAAAPAEVVVAANEDLPEAIHFIKASTGKMDRLIAAILKLSREGRRVMAPEPIAMRPFLQGIADSLQHQSDASGAEIVIQTMTDITADRVMLEQIFSNLIENALKYLQPGRPGRIAVNGYRQGEAVVFEVCDNGRGIAARDHERVFELFRRAGDQRVPGEGIGLAHVRALVRRLGGTIGCDSREGVGSTFHVRLPIAGEGMGETA